MTCRCGDIDCPKCGWIDYNPTNTTHEVTEDLLQLVTTQKNHIQELEEEIKYLKNDVEGYSSSASRIIKSLLPVLKDVQLLETLAARRMIIESLINWLIKEQKQLGM